ncbi:hypothetical protein Tco_0615341 [Tanacetum coccineum]
MLVPEDIQMETHFLLRYIDTKPNGDGLRKSILSGPYVPSTVLVQVVAATEGRDAGESVVRRLARRRRLRTGHTRSRARSRSGRGVLSAGEANWAMAVVFRSDCQWLAGILISIQWRPMTVLLYLLEETHLLYYRIQTIDSRIVGDIVFEVNTSYELQGRKVLWFGLRGKSDDRASRVGRGHYGETILTLEINYELSSGDSCLWAGSEFSAPERSGRSLLVVFVVGLDARGTIWYGSIWISLKGSEQVKRLCAEWRKWLLEVMERGVECGLVTETVRVESGKVDKLGKELL